MAAPTLADREGFAVLAARLLVTRGLVSSAEPRLSAFALDVVADGGKRTLYLHDAMAEALAANPTERTAVITACAEWLLDRPATMEWPDVKPRLRPVLRGAWFGTDATHRWQPKGIDPHFAVFAAYDVPGAGLRYVTGHDFVAWGTGEKEVFSAARTNFKKVLEGLDLTVEAADTQLRLYSPGIEPSSLVIFPERLEAVLAREGAHPIVAVPDRRTLYARRAQPDTLPPFVEQALEAFASASQPLSPIALSISREGKSALKQLDSHAPVVAAKRRLLMETYAAQARILRSRFPDDEIPEPTERIGDLTCEWNEGKHALLPECGSVKLVPRKGSRTETLEWWSVKSLIGSTFVEEPGLFPPRWRAFPWKRDDVRAFDDEEEDEAPDPEMEAHFAEEEAQWGYDEGSGDEEDQYDDDAWSEGDPDVLCPFCGSGLKGEKTCEVCGRTPAEAKSGVAKPIVAPTHAIRVLQALVDGKLIELASRRALPAVGRAIAETLDGTSDWQMQAVTLSARLLSMEEVTEVFADDLALADVLARTAANPASPDAQLEAKVKAVESAEAATLAESANAALARRVLRELMSEGALDIEWDTRGEIEGPLGRLYPASATPDEIARITFGYLRDVCRDSLHAESADELREMVERVTVAPAAPVPAPPDPVSAEKPDAAKLPAAKRLLRRLLDEGHVEMVAGGSLELVENAIAQLLMSADANDPDALHALLDEMDEDLVLFADAAVLGSLPKR